MNISEFFPFCDRKCVTSFILRMPIVPFYPKKFNLMAGKFGKKFFPQINIKRRFLSDFRQPFFRQPYTQPLVTESQTYFESVVSLTSHGSFKALSASIQAVSSIRLFVVSRSPPDNSFLFPLYWSTAPQPPGPGLPEHAPSVYINTCFIFITKPLISPKNNSNRKTAFCRRGDFFVFSQKKNFNTF